MKPLLALVVAAAPTLALAQTTSTSDAPSTPPQGVQCLTRSFADASGTARPLTIYVPATEAATYAALGFATSACGSMSITAYRGEACRIAHLGNDAVQARLTQVLGARPTDLCESAKRAAPFPTDTSGN